MRMFPIPFDIQKEDKVIGGKLSIRQLIWLAIPCITIILLLLIDTRYILKTDKLVKIKTISLTIRIIVSLITVIIAVFMSYKKINMQKADKFCFKLAKYHFRKKTLRYGR